jgi:SSS family solute:Na+ symporter
LILAYAPPGLAGLMLAGLLAAIMSSVDSALNSASTLVIHDFVAPRRPGLGPKQLARLGRYVTLAMMVIAAAWAPAIDRFPGLFAYLQQAFAYVTPPLVAVFAVGMTSRRVGAQAALRALVTGHAVSAAWFVATQAGWLGVHFTIVAGILFALTLVAAFAWQAAGGAAAGPEQWQVFAREGRARTSPGVLAGAAAIALITVALVVAFR